MFLSGPRSHPFPAILPRPFSGGHIGPSRLELAEPPFPKQVFLIFLPGPNLSPSDAASNRASFLRSFLLPPPTTEASTRGNLSACRSVGSHHILEVGKPPARGDIDDKAEPFYTRTVTCPLLCDTRAGANERGRDGFGKEAQIIQLNRSLSG